MRDYNLDINILKASITPVEEGLLILKLSGEQNNYDQGIQYLTRTGGENPGAQPGCYPQ